jgi:hypothetical protein
MLKRIYLADQEANRGFTGIQEYVPVTQKININ